jgi:putative Ig domain-containing protein
MVSTAKSLFAFILVISLGALLGGCEGSTSGSADTATASSTSANAGLAISGSPAQSIAVGAAYNFKPVVSAVAGSAISFSIANKPGWASFDATTGTLSGVPTAANVGLYSKIQISASDGGVTTALAPFSISVTLASNGSSLSISGSAPAAATVGSFYNFVPTAVDASGATLTFAVSNAPSWATFNPKTGALSGTPAASNVGTDANILISVSDGTHSAALTAFSISVTAATAESVTLSWTPPSTNSNGTPVSDLAGYRIYYGTSAASLTTVITVNGADDTNQVIKNLTSGTWYFAVTSFNSDKIESALSAVLPLTI